MSFNTNSHELVRISGLSNPRECEGKHFIDAECVQVQPRGCTELVYTLLAALPRSRLASIQRHIAPLLPFDILSVRVQLCSISSH